jgi:tRNA (guanine37-N1)-methyltransferase
MRIDILTLFPGMFEGPFREGMIGRGSAAGLLDIRIHDIRDHGIGRHRVVDDAPYGGGAGMVLKPEPVVECLEAVTGLADFDVRRGPLGPDHPRVVLLTPQGRRFDQALARDIARSPWLVLICGHYEGFDERIRLRLATDEISVGDYVLTGGEIPAMVLVDAVGRLVPGVLGRQESLEEESHSAGLLEYPHYTRPAEFRGDAIPPILVSGHHAEVAKWRRRQSLRRTWERRPDLLERSELTEEDRIYLRALETDETRS